MNCSKCDTILPNDAQFCIECGTPTVPAATGPTQRIEQRVGPRCTSCQTINPAGATFCVTCGAALHGASRTLVAGTPPAPIGTAYDNQPLAAGPRPLPPVAVARKRKGRKRRPFGRKLDDVSGGIFLIGLAVLLFNGWIWPGILVLVGVTGMIGALGRGRISEAFQALIWPVGLTVLFMTGWIWPGILVLVGMSAILGAFSHPWETWSGS